jgi:hypothetical protein
MDDARPIALKLGAINVARLRIFSPARVAGLLGERREDVRFIRFHLLPRLPALKRVRGPRRIICHKLIIRRCAYFASLEL